jgi:transcriptional regulator with XRE-family HTH domain
MDYASLLRDYITKSGLSLSQIATELNKRGFSTDKGYISKLQNAKIPSAGEPMNKALAEITGGDADKLSWYAYVEKAPEGFKNILQQLGEEIIPAGKKLLEEFPGFFERDYDLDELLDSPTYKDFQDVYDGSITKLGYLDIRNFKEKSDSTSAKANSIVESSVKMPMHLQILNTAKQMLENNLNYDSVNKLAIVEAHLALELRVGEVLLKDMVQTSNTQEELAFDYLKMLPLREKINGPLRKNFDLRDITFGEFSDLLILVDLRSTIVHGKHPDEITKEKAKEMVDLVDKVLNAIDRNAREKGIE